MKFKNGKVSATKEDLEKLAAEGFDLSFHTDYYINYCVITLPNCDRDGDRITIGFHNWMDNLDIYNGDEKVYIKSAADLRRFIKELKVIKKGFDAISEIAGRKL